MGNLKTRAFSAPVLTFILAAASFCAKAWEPDQAFFRLAGTKTVRKYNGQSKHWQRRYQVAYKLKNTAPNRDVSTKDPTEYFSRHLDLYLTSPNYADRFPTFEEYFANRFGRQPRQANYLSRVLIREGEAFTAAELDPERLYQVDYLLASKGDNFMSGFGHSMIRLVYCDPARFSGPSFVPGPECLDDHSFHIVVSFRAQIHDLAINNVKGLFGGYPSRLFFIPFNEIKKEYNRDSFRDLMAYKLELTSAQKRRLVERSLELYWTYRADYKFATNNCADETLSLVESALWDAPVDIRDRTTPYGVLDELEDNDIVAERPIVFKNRQQDYRAYAKRLADLANEKITFETYTEMPAMERLRVIHKAIDRANAQKLDKRSSLRAAGAIGLLEKFAARKKMKEARSRLPKLAKRGRLSEEDIASIKDFVSATDNFSLADKNGLGIPGVKELIPLELLSARLGEASQNYSALKTQAAELIPGIKEEHEISSQILTMLKEFKTESRRLE